MKRGEIQEIGIDETGRLYIMPLSEKFPFMYREAIEVHWDSKGDFLHSPSNLKGWSYFDWFRQIMQGAKMQGCTLCINHKTKWINVPETLKEQILHWHEIENS